MKRFFLVAIAVLMMAGSAAATGFRQEPVEPVDPLKQNLGQTDVQGNQSTIEVAPDIAETARVWNGVYDDKEAVEVYLKDRCHGFQVCTGIYDCPQKQGASEGIAWRYPGSTFACSGGNGVVVADGITFKLASGQVYSTINSVVGDGLTRITNFESRTVTVKDDNGNYLVFTVPRSGAGHFIDAKLPLSMASSASLMQASGGVAVSNNELINVLTQVYERANYQGKSYYSFSNSLLLYPTAREQALRAVVEGVRKAHSPAPAGNK